MHNIAKITWLFYTTILVLMVYAGWSESIYIGLPLLLIFLPIILIFMHFVFVKTNGE